MTRRIYGLLRIAQRHPRMFAAMHAKARDRSDVEDGSYGVPQANDAMHFDMDCDAALKAERDALLPVLPVPGHRPQAVAGETFVDLDDMLPQARSKT